MKPEGRIGRGTDAVSKKEVRYKTCGWSGRGADVDCREQLIGLRRTCHF